MSVHLSLKAGILRSLLLFGSGALAQFPKPVLFSDGLSPHVDNVFWQHLAPTHSTWEKWAWGWIPQACKDRVAGTAYNAYDIEVYNVFYDDCSTPFIICRHNQAQMTVINMIDAFGRMPVHDRQWTQHILALPDSGCSAGTGGMVTTFHGPCYVPSVFIHELTHTLDAFVNEKTGSNGDAHVYSTTTPYLNAVSSDSCVPDPYANNSPQEDYAQVSVLAIYEKVNPGGLDPIGAWRCLVNSKNNQGTIIGNAITPGGTCTRRWPDSPAVCMGPAAGCTSSKRTLLTNRGQRKAGPKPQVANKKGDPLVGDVTLPPFDVSTIEVRPYENLAYNQTAGKEATIRINAWNAAVGKETVPVDSA
ncbi:hypothetical protein GQ53DRAFT_882789 [Thozetella sp. PMI_491]|nr:hypothetical protein GQ53DRAFT_882789 [Thozetella sp. PMI_491]